MNLGIQAISGLKWASVEKFGRAGFQLLQISILTRFLPKEAFGLIAIALVVIGFSNIFADLGLASAILYKQDATQKEYSSLYWLNLAISTILFSILLMISPFVAEFYEEPELLTVIPILGSNILIMTFGRQHRTILQKEFRFKAIAIVELLSYSIGLVVAVILAARDYGVYSLVYSTLVASIIANLLFLFTNIKSNPISLHFRFNETKAFLRVGSYQTGSRVFDFISQEADVFIIGKLLGAEVLGVYTLSKQIVLKVFNIINPIISNVLSPLLSSIQKDSKRLKNTFLKLVKYLAYINFPLYLAIIVGSKEVLNILYGSSYVEASTVLVFLAAYYCLISISNPVGSLQIATGRTDLGFYWTILRVLVTPMVIFIGAQFGINAVALSIFSLSIVLLLPMWYVQLKPMLNIGLLEYVNQFYKPLLLFLIFVFAYLLGDHLLALEVSIAYLIGKEIVVLGLFLFLLFIFDGKAIKEIYELVIKNK